MNKKFLLSFIILCSVFVSCISMSDTQKNELIILNPTLFHNEDNFVFIGKINLSTNRFVEIYFTEYLFANNRATYRLVFFDNNNSISCYKIEDKPILINNILVFPYKKELGNEIKIKDNIPNNIYLDGEIIELLIIR